MSRLPKSFFLVTGLAFLMLGVSARTVEAGRNHAGWGWETYFLSQPYSLGGWWGAHYGGPKGIVAGAAPHYGNYGGWYSRHYVIGTHPWIPYDGALNRKFDERYNPSFWNYGGVSHLIVHPTEDVNAYVPDGAGPKSEAHNLRLEIQVPPEAKIYINGEPTSSSGSIRHFVTESLEEGATYDFEVRAVLEESEGKEEQIKRVSLQAGDEAKLRFRFGSQKSQSRE